MFLDARLKIRNFFKKYKYIILIAIITWIIIILINNYLGKIQQEAVPSTSYKKHESIMDSSVNVPVKLQAPIENLIGEYIEYCNNKEYEKAYNMLEEKGRKESFKDINQFKEYVDSVFTSKKIYNIQNYSNTKDIYIYRVRILDDIMATGMTGVDELKYYEEKFTVKETENGLTLSIKNYVETKTLAEGYEDDYMQVNIIEKVSRYNTEKYTLKIKNKTDNVIVISDFVANDEILLQLESETRRRATELLKPIIIYENETITVDLEFAKYYDEDKTSQAILFNAIRVLEKYIGTETDIEDNSNNVVKKYSVSINVNVE